MLILTRRIGETIMIGDQVTCTVLAVKGNHVRVGISAPRQIEVHREEIYKRVKAQRTQAASEAAAAELAEEPELVDSEAETPV